MQISDAKVFQAKRRRWPSLSLSAEASLADLLSDNADWSTALIRRLAGSILNAGRIANEIRAAEADASIAWLIYQRTVIQALQDALDSLTELEHQRAIFKVRENEVRTNERLCRLARKSFEAGSIDFINFLEVQRNLFTATERIVDAKRDCLAAVINSYPAMGVPPKLTTISQAAWRACEDNTSRLGSIRMRSSLECACAIETVEEARASSG